LTRETESDCWTSRTREAFRSLRNEYEFLRPDADVAITDRLRNEVRWYTFAGAVINGAFADVISAQRLERIGTDDFCVRVDGSTDGRRVVDEVRTKVASEIRGFFEIAEEFLDNLKFNECLPSDLAIEILKDRMLDMEELGKSLARDVVDVNE